MNEISRAAKALAALGHEKRLSVYRLLVVAGEKGLTVGELLALLNIPASTLAHHLSALLDAELISQERDGRQIVSYASYNQMDWIVEFLKKECCKGFE